MISERGGIKKEKDIAKWEREIGRSLSKLFIFQNSHQTQYGRLSNPKPMGGDLTHHALYTLIGIIIYKLI